MRWPISVLDDHNMSYLAFLETVKFALWIEFRTFATCICTTATYTALLTDKTSNAFTLSVHPLSLDWWHACSQITVDFYVAKCAQWAGVVSTVCGGHLLVWHASRDIANDQNNSWKLCISCTLLSSELTETTPNSKVKKETEQGCFWMTQRILNARVQTFHHISIIDEITISINMLPYKATHQSAAPICAVSDIFQQMPNKQC